MCDGWTYTKLMTRLRVALLGVAFLGSRAIAVPSNDFTLVSSPGVADVMQERTFVYAVCGVQESSNGVTLCADAGNAVAPSIAVAVMSPAKS